MSTPTTPGRTIPGLKTHAPTGRVPWPLILLEGQEKSGRSWSIAEFSRSERIGTLYWIDLNEGAAEEYGAIPGANYQVVEMETGDYHELLRVLQILHKEAERARDAGEKPVALGIDSGTAIWSGLKDWASSRARSSSRGQALLRRDPNAEVKISTNLWNDSTSRWRKIQTLLATFPGPVIITARGKEVAVIGADGNPIEGQREWSVDCHKELPYTATAWVRMQRTVPPVVIGARSVHAGIKPGADDPKPITDPRAQGRLLEWLIFDLLRVDAAQVGARDFREFTGGGLTEEEKARPEEGEPDQSQAAQHAPGRQARRGRTAEQWLAGIAACTDVEGAHRLWAEASAAGLLTADIDGVDLGDRIRARGEDIKAGAVTGAPAAVVASPGSAGAVGDGSGSPAGSEEEEPAAGDVAGPAGGRSGDAVVVSAVADDPVECRPTAARRGVLASLGALGVGERQIAVQFGRPAEQVATRRLTELVRMVIAARRGGLAEAEAEPGDGPETDATDPEPEVEVEEPVEQVPDTDVKPGKLRAAVLAALTELFDTEDARDAAIEQVFGKPLAMVGNRRLAELLRHEQEAKV